MALIGILLLGQSLLIYIATSFLIGVVMGPDLLRDSTGARVGVGILTAGIMWVLVHLYGTPTEEDLEEDSEEE